MIRKILQKVGLAAMLAGSLWSISDEARSQKPTPQTPAVATAQKQEDYTVNGLGQIYHYKTKAEQDLAHKVLDVATDMQTKHGHLPYVWGGDGFEPLETQKRLYGKQVTDKQPAGSWRENQPTVPGVDCSGLIFQINRFLALPYGRLTAADYAKKSKEIINPSTNIDRLKEAARPGDLFFFTRDKKIVHVVLYLGNGYAIESAGAREDVSSLPKKDLEAWKVYAKPQEHKKTDQDYGGIEVIKIENIARRYELSALHRWPEFLSDEEKEQEKKAGKKKVK